MPMSEYVPDADLELSNFVQQVRSYTRDYPELNRLIAGVESSNRQIIWALFDAIDDFNTTPPLIGNFSLADFPSKSLLIRGTVISLLESIGLLQTRNHIAFQDGGLQVGVNDKTPFIMNWLQLLKGSYEEKKTRLKVAMNMQIALNGSTGLWSEYAYIQGFYGEW